MSTTIESSSTWYHASSGGSSSVAWQRGGPRKGLINKQREIGLVVFAAADIAAAVESGDPPGGVLRLSRDSAYGEGEVDITIAPALVQTEPGDATYADAIEIAMRNLHHTVTITGTVSDIGLPGAWLRLMTLGQCNAVLIYREGDEGSDAEIRFADGAQLVLEDAGTYVPPVWTRPVGQGDIISDHIRSHIGDLYEIEYYCNIRRALVSLAAIDISADNDVGLYADWPGVIDDLRDAMDELINEEQGTAVTWCDLDPDELPKAEAINQLRNALTNVGPEESVTVTTFGRTTFSHEGSDFKVNKDTAVTWYAKAPFCGMSWEYQYETKPNGIRVGIQVYKRRFGFWILGDLIAGKVVNSLVLSAVRTGGFNGVKTVNLYACIAQDMPAGKASVNAIMDSGMLCGTASAARGGEMRWQLSAECVAALKAGTIYGVAIGDGSDYSEFSSATLIINGTA